MVGVRAEVAVCTPVVVDAEGTAASGVVVETGPEAVVGVAVGGATAVDYANVDVEVGVGVDNDTGRVWLW